jgi:hypothetical protein
VCLPVNYWIFCNLLLDAHNLKKLFKNQKLEVQAVLRDYLSKEEISR